MRTRTYLTALVYPMVNAVLFGAGVIAVLGLPLLKAEAMILMPLVVVASFVVAVPLAWWIAPRMRLRWWRARRRPGSSRGPSQEPSYGAR